MFRRAFEILTRSNNEDWQQYSNSSLAGEFNEAMLFPWLLYIIQGLLFRLPKVAPGAETLKQEAVETEREVLGHRMV